jgi:hypothetical protein
VFGGQIDFRFATVKHPDGVAHFSEMPHQVGADETGSANNQDLHDDDLTSGRWAKGALLVDSRPFGAMVRQITSLRSQRDRWNRFEQKPTENGGIEGSKGSQGIYTQPNSEAKMEISGKTLFVFLGTSFWLPRRVQIQRHRLTARLIRQSSTTPVGVRTRFHALRLAYLEAR